MGCLAGSLSAGAVEGQAAASRPRLAPPKDCPSPEDLESVLGEASAQMGQSRFQEAASVLQPLADSHCDARVSLLLAAAFEGQGDVAQATMTLQKAHTLWPTNDSIAASLAREYLNKREIPKAVDALAHFHVAAGTPEQEMRLVVVVYLAARRLVPAESVAEAAFRAYPSESTLLLLANTMQMQGRYPDVNRLLASKRNAYAESPQFLVTLAESEFDASSYPEARADLEHAVALDPNLYQAHYLLGNVLHKQGSLDEAIAEYRKAIALSPDQPRSYFQLALALQAKQDEAGEQSALEQALAADNRYAPAQCELGRILLDEHRPADAVTHLNAAIESNPQSEKAYFLLVRAYGQLGQKDKSDEMVKRLLVVKQQNRAGAGGKNEDTPAPRSVGP